MSKRIMLVASMFLVSGVMLQAQFGLPIPNASICNSGRTPKGLPPSGCLATVLAGPVNPGSGGSTIDGNWELATPYPSKLNTQAPPDPCTLITSWGPSWVDAPNYLYYNPNDGLSQWITPFNGEFSPPGWYVYRTGFTVPAAEPGYAGYVLKAAGQVMADNQNASIYVLDADAALSTCRAVAVTSGTGFQNWTTFRFSTPVIPLTHGYIYFVMQNDGTDLNATGLRVEFSTPHYYPYWSSFR